MKVYFGIVVVVLALSHHHTTLQSVVAGQAPIGSSNSGVEEYMYIYLGTNKSKQIIIHMITEAHLSTPQTKIKVRFAHVRVRYMRYSYSYVVQVATETEKVAYYPEEIDRMKKTNRR